MEWTKRKARRSARTGTLGFVAVCLGSATAASCPACVHGARLLFSDEVGPRSSERVRDAWASFPSMPLVAPRCHTTASSANPGTTRHAADNPPRSTPSAPPTASASNAQFHRLGRPTARYQLPPGAATDVAQRRRARRAQQPGERRTFSHTFSNLRLHTRPPFRAAGTKGTKSPFRQKQIALRRRGARFVPAALFDVAYPLKYRCGFRLRATLETDPAHQRPAVRLSPLEPQPDQPSREARVADA